MMNTPRTKTDRSTQVASRFPPAFVAMSGVVVIAAGCGTMRMEIAMDGPMQIQGPMMRYEGVYISDVIFDRVMPGETSVAMTLALFGEPSEQHVLPDGTEIWKWIYREHGIDTSIASVINNSDKESPSLPQVITFVEIRDEVIVGKWRS